MAIKGIEKKGLRVLVSIVADSRYRFEKKRIREAVAKLLEEKKLKGNYQISVSVVGERKIKELKKKYLNEEGVADVLSFPQMEGKVALADDAETIVLGDVVVCYPQAKRQAMGLNRLLDEEIEFLVLHGVLHLLGIHHD